MQDLMILLPGGTIKLRDDRLEKQWAVNLEPFLISKFPVTQELYFTVTQTAPSTFIGGQKPVDSVTWADAVSFCNLLSSQEALKPCYFTDPTSAEYVFDSNAGGYRLPTEAEWEYACKAGTSGARYGDLDRIAWYKNNSGGTTRPVGEKEPNPWGLYDMLGNVWEWCSDIYDESVYGSYRLLRGGGWNDEARGCLATNRRRSHPTSFKIDDLGFRVARNYQP